MKKLFYILLVTTIIGTTNAQSNNKIIIKKINITGNKITKNNIIIKELTFEIGDTIASNKLDSLCKKSEENLMNSSLFNFVTVKYTTSDNSAEININLVEQWYIWPIPIFEHADRNLSSFFHNGDWSRINYGAFLAVYNFRGRKEVLKFKIRFGYKEQYGFMYSKPNLDKAQKHGLTVESSYFRQHEIAYATQNNQLEYYRNDNEFTKTSIRATLGYQYRQTLYTYHKISLQYNNILINDSVAIKNPEYLGDSVTNTQYLNLSYGFTNDKRNYIYYPTKGHYFHTSISYKGFVFKETNVAYIKTKFSWYKPLVNRLFFGQTFSGKLSNNYEQPYYLIEGFGYADMLRGYEYYVIDGNNNILIKNNLRFNILKRKDFKLGFIPWEQFNKSYLAIYLNTYFDIGYVYNKYEPANTTNTMVNSWQYSGGIGLDLVTYYDTVFRIEYSINKFGESGFFIHLGSGI